MDLEEFRAGERILFNDRKIPCEIEAVDENRLHVNGPQGGEYIIFPAEDDPETLLVANKGSREYASLVKDLRKVGRWVQDGDAWKHSKTGKEIRLEKNGIGFWTVDTDLDTDPDLPKYGFSEKEFAVEEVEGLIKKFPEGKT